MLNVDQVNKQLHILDSGDDAAQRQALHTLRNIEAQNWSTAPNALVNSLVEALQQQILSGPRPPVVHKEIAALISNVGTRSKSAIPQLIQFLQDGTPDSIREAAATVLGKFGSDAKSAVESLIAISSVPSSLGVHAVRALRDIGCADHRVRTALIQLWNAPIQSQNNQIQLAIALCKLKIDAVGLVPFLTNRLLASQDEALRKSAAEGLSWCNKNDLDVVPALVTSTLNDKNEDVRQIAKNALDHLKLSNEKAIDLCAKQLKDSLHAEAALRKTGQPAVPALILALGGGDATVRVKAARILACFGELGANAVPALMTALRDKDWEIRLEAAKGLWNITKKTDDVVPVLIQLLDDKRATDIEDGEARRRILQTVIESLWRIGPPASAAVPALLKMTKDKNRLVSQSAREAVKKIQPSAIK